ncbi:hypothetical protein DFJ73DRAFT_544250 [Zopfochytrium polystomum]|nr:hypothetical protein DFJ73DRAFT_544250 [Zopfochytrium polystomum]
MSHFYFKEELYPDSYAEASWTPLGLAPSESVSANSSHLHQNHQHQHFYQQLQPPTNQPPSSTRQKFQFVESWLPPVSSAHPVSPSKAAAILPFSRHQYPVSTPPPPPPLPIVPSRAAPAGPPQLPNYPSPPHLASGPFLGGEDPAYSLGSHQFHQPSASLPVYPLRSVMVGTERDHPSYATHPAEVVSVLSNSPPPSFSSAQHTPSWQHSADPASRNHSSGDYCGHAPLPRSQQVFQPSELSSLPVSPASYVFSPLPPSASNGHPHNGGVSSYEASRHFPSRESYQLVQPACGPAASNALPPYVVGSNNTYSANTCSGYYYGYQSGSVQPRPAQPFDRNEYIHLT